MLPFTLRRPLASVNSLAGLVTTVKPLQSSQSISGRIDEYSWAFAECDVIERPDHAAAILKLIEQALVVDVEAEPLAVALRLAPSTKMAILEEESVIAVPARLEPCASPLSP
jgi:hypothetical protein